MEGFITLVIVILISAIISREKRNKNHNKNNKETMNKKSPSEQTIKPLNSGSKNPNEQTIKPLNSGSNSSKTIENDIIEEEHDNYINPYYIEEDLTEDLKTSIIDIKSDIVKDESIQNNEIGKEDITFTREDLIKGIIMKEILSKPKALQKNG